MTDLVSTPADILVPAGRPGAQVQESDLLHAGFHRAAVFMCQPLLPWRQVRTALKTRRKKKKGRAWPWQKDSMKDRYCKLLEITWMKILGPKHSLTHLCLRPHSDLLMVIQLFSYALNCTLQFLGWIIIKMGDDQIRGIFCDVDIYQYLIPSQLSCEPSVFQL